MGLLVACSAPSNMSSCQHQHLLPGYKRLAHESPDIKVLKKVEKTLEEVKKKREQPSEAPDKLLHKSSEKRQDARPTPNSLCYCWPSMTYSPQLACYVLLLWSPVGPSPCSFVFDHSDNDLVAGYISGELHSITAGGDPNFTRWGLMFNNFFLA